MKLIFLSLVFLAGCASQHRPEYETVTQLNPDCMNRDAQIRYLNKLRQVPGDAKYTKTLDIQVERLSYYCQ